MSISLTQVTFLGAMYSFIIFDNYLIEILFVISDIKTTDPNLYNILTSHLSAEQQKSFEEIFVLADQRKAAAGMFVIFYLFI